MKVTRLTPVLNVSNLQESVAWFEKLGWEKGWEWDDPAIFGGVSSGDYEIFLCENAQGGRGKGSNRSTFDTPEDATHDQGVWMSVWVDDVDEVFEHCRKNDIEVTLEPKDMPWNVRELLVRHPDGHVFRMTRGIGALKK